VFIPIHDGVLLLAERKFNITLFGKPSRSPVVSNEDAASEKRQEFTVPTRFGGKLTWGRRFIVKPAPVCPRKKSGSRTPV
jgi:hypothetical protein